MFEDTASVVSASPLRINIGCGSDVRPGWTNIDQFSLPGVDLVLNLASEPLPFDDGTVDEVLAKDVLEHIDYVPVLKELHRVMKPGGLLRVQVPHFTSADNYIDPTHVRLFSVRTFEFFVESVHPARGYYFPFKFSAIESRRLSFMRFPLFYNHLVELLVNLNDKTRKYYELTGLCAIFPATSIEVVIRR